MLQNILKFLVLIAIMIAIPILWWQSLKAGANLRTFMFSTGFSLFLFGLCYKLMGSWDLIPDWIPILGTLDDKFAWLVMLVGVALGLGSFALS